MKNADFSTQLLEHILVGPDHEQELNELLGNYHGVKFKEHALGKQYEIKLKKPATKKEHLKIVVDQNHLLLKSSLTEDSFSNDLDDYITRSLSIPTNSRLEDAEVTYINGILDFKFKTENEKSHSILIAI